VIPDLHAKPGVPTSHYDAIGRYALDKRPDVIVQLGDCGDFRSLSSYDSPAAKGFDQRDYADDARCANEAARLLLAPISNWNKSNRKSRQYHPRCVMLMGNHEERIVRAAQNEPWLRSVLLDPLQYAAQGWEVIPFLQPVIINDISHSHYFCRNAKGHVVQSRRGMPSAMAQVIREGMSAIAGHKQGLDSHIQPIGDGRRHRGLIAGSCYQHREDYLTEQGNDHWHGCLLLNEIRDGGDFDLVEVSMGWLLRRWA